MASSIDSGLLIRRHHPRFRALTDAELGQEPITLARRLIRGQRGHVQSTASLSIILPDG
jgi:hypothetical protein